MRHTRESGQTSGSTIAASLSARAGGVGGRSDIGKGNDIDEVSIVILGTVDERLIACPETTSDLDGVVKGSGVIVEASSGGAGRQVTLKLLGNGNQLGSGAVRSGQGSDSRDDGGGRDGREVSLGGGGDRGRVAEERRAVRLKAGSDNGGAGTGDGARNSGLAGVRGVGVGEAVRDGIVVTAAPLAVVGGIAVVPGLGVQGAVLSLGNSILQDEEGVEELASLSGGVCGRMSNVVLGLSGTGSCAELRIEGAIGEDFGTQESVVSSAVEGSVDGVISQVDGGAVPGLIIGALGNVAVGSSNHNLELVAPLAAVVGGVLVDGTTPEDTLDDIGASGVGAGIGGFLDKVRVWSLMLVKRVKTYNRGITLEVDVESNTAVDGIALGSASLSVVASEGSVTHVAIGTAGSLQVLEGVEVTRGSSSIVGSRREVSVAQESGRSIGVRDGAVSDGLRLASGAFDEALLLRLDRRSLLGKRAGLDLGDDAGGSSVGIVGNDGRGSTNRDGGLRRLRGIVNDLPDKVLGLGERDKGADDRSRAHFE